MITLIELTRQFKNAWTPVVDIIPRTSPEITDERQSTRGTGRDGEDGWLAANALSSVNVTALKMSNNVAVFERVLRLIVLKYPSIVFVLSSERTSRRNGPRCAITSRRADTRAFTGSSTDCDVNVTFLNVLISGNSSTSSALLILDGKNESRELVRRVVNMDLLDACKRSSASMNARSDASARAKRIDQKRPRRSDLAPVLCCMFLAM